MATLAAGASIERSPGSSLSAVPRQARRPTTGNALVTSGIFEADLPRRSSLGRRPNFLRRTLSVPCDAGGSADGSLLC